MINKYIELAKKLNALATKGQGGEKYNAQTALDNLMAKYNITMQDIDEDTRHEAEFYAPKISVMLFFQIVASVTGKGRNVMCSRKNNSHKYIEVTRAEELEIRAKWGFYKNLFDQQLKRLVHAFIVANQIWCLDEEPVDKVPTPEEIKELLKVRRMAEGLEKVNYLKQINE